MENRIGIAVECKYCHRDKAPHGRSVPDLRYGQLCTVDECEYYNSEPLPGCLWPGETSEDFGFNHCLNATALKRGEIREAE